MQSPTSQRIIRLLENHQEPLTVSFISFSLEDCPFDEVRNCLNELQQSGSIILDAYGYSLYSQPAPPVSQPAPFADAAEAHEAAGAPEAHEAERAKKSEGLPASPPPDVLIASACEPLLGVQSAVDQEYLAMLEEFSAQPHGTAPALDTHHEEQVASEYEELLAMLNQPPAEPEEPEPAQEPPQQGATDEPSSPSADPLPNLTYRSPVSVLGLTGRAGYVFHRRSIGTIADLVRQLDSLEALPNVGKQTLSDIDNALLRHATSLPATLSDQQVGALCQVSGSSRFAFDIFGRLCHVSKEPSVLPRVVSEPRQSASASLSVLFDDPTPIEDVGLPRRLTNALLRTGHETLGEAAKLSDEEILSMRGIGALMLDTFREKLNALALASSLLANKSAPSEQPPHEVALSPQNTDPAAAHAAIHGVCPEAREGVALSLALCKERSFPLYDEAFMACMPYSVQESIGAHRSPEEYRDAALDMIRSSDEAIEACESILRDWLAAARALETGTRLAEPIRVPAAPEWEEAAQHLAKQDPLCSYSTSSHTMQTHRPTLMYWVSNSGLSDRNASLLRRYLRGSTLQACGDEFGLTRERVRQLVTHELHKAPLLEEDRHRHFFKTYDLTRDQFLLVTGEPQSTYIYLRLTSKTHASRMRPMGEALKDELVPHATRDGIRRLMDIGYLYADGSRIPQTREGIITHIVSRYASSKLIKVERLRELYEQFLRDNGLTSAKGLSFSSMRTFEAYIDRLDQVMKLSHSVEGRYGGSIRHYDAPSMDFSALVQALSSGFMGDIECSATLLMDREELSDILEELDIHNGYELHYVLSHYCPRIDGLTIGRSPNLSFGNGNRNDQILEMIKQLSPVTATDLAEAYAQQYGVDCATFMGSYLGDFKIYLRHGKYVYNDEGLTKAQRDFITEQLQSTGRDYLSLSLIKARFKDKFPKASTSLINASNLSGLGFHPSGGLLVRNGVDERKLFGALLDSQQRFSINDDGFGKDVFENQSFKAELAIRVRAYQLIEFEKDSYLSLHMLSDLDTPLCAEDFKDYLESVINFIPPETPFTIKSLTNAGFTHKIDALRDDFGISDYFYESILVTGYVGGRLKGTSLGEVMVFCKTLYNYSSPALIEHILSWAEAIEVDDLSYLLEDTYGIALNNAHLRSIIKRSELFFSETLDMVFDSEETYRRKAQEWIS